MVKNKVELKMWTLSNEKDLFEIGLLRQEINSSKQILQNEIKKLKKSRKIKLQKKCKKVQKKLDKLILLDKSYYDCLKDLKDKKFGIYRKY